MDCRIFSKDSGANNLTRNKDALVYHIFDLNLFEIKIILSVPTNKNKLKRERQAIVVIVNSGLH